MLRNMVGTITVADMNCTLQELLLAYGEYPSKYRLLVWDFLLRLPHNSNAFQVPLLAGSPRKAFNNLPTICCTINTKALSEVGP